MQKMKVGSKMVYSNALTLTSKLDAITTLSELQ